MANKKLKILIAAAEAAPIAKVGGLGDVIGSLPKALEKLGADARVIIPLYGSIDNGKREIKPLKKNIKISRDSINLKQTRLPDSSVPVYLVEHECFKNGGVYSADMEKFILFSRAILPSAQAAGFMPDVVHLNDWHTAETAGILGAERKINDFFKRTKSLYTIHNLANQGKTKTKNYMAEGILNADFVNTVSPSYAEEILTEEFGAGLENILQKRKNRLCGILNGIDENFFNPETDDLIEQKYSAKNLKGKATNKSALQKQFGLPADKNAALIGLVSRLEWQKGVDLISEEFSRLNCQFVFLGTGEKKYEDALLKLAEKFPRRFGTRIGFDEKLAHLIYAGSDMFLMPSRFEPCGLGQMIAMRYGSVPVARATGGISDTVNDKTGFIFKKCSSEELRLTLCRAISAFHKNKTLWRSMRIKGMKQDFSWRKSAREYLNLYKQLAELE